MAISVNASVARFAGTPNDTTPIDSASFTPADNSLLVVCANADEQAGVIFAVTGGSLTFTERVRRGFTESSQKGIAAIWTAPVTTGTSMAVSVARTAADASNRLSAKVYIVTGQHASPIGNSNSADWTANPQTTSLTAAGGGRVFGCGTDWNQTGIPTSTDTADGADYAGEISVMSAFKAADHASGTQGIQFDPVGAPSGNVVVLEILAAGGGGGGGPSPIRLTRESGSGGMGPQMSGGMSASPRLWLPRRTIFLPGRGRTRTELRPR